MKIGDKVKCVSLWASNGTSRFKSDYLKLGEYYIIENFLTKENDLNIVVNVQFVNNTNLNIAYHPSHFRTLKQERKLKLKKINHGL